MTDLKVADLIRERAAGGEQDPDVLAGQVVGDIMSLGLEVGLLSDLVRPQVVTYLRATARATEEAWDQAEKTVSTAERHGHHSADAVNAAVRQREHLVRAGFYAPGFGRVTWGQATIQHHKAAAEHSRSIAGAHEADARRHDKAVRLITDAKVSSLDEVPGFTDATVEAWPVAA